MPASRSALLLIATSCAATLVLITTMNTSCGVVSVSSACADQCPDVVALQDRVNMLEASVSTIRAALDPVVFFASLDAPQSVPDATDTVVALDNIVAGAAAFNRTTYEYTASIAGQYVITATIGYKDMTSARANAEIWIARMNAPAVGQTVVTVPGNSSMTGSTTLRINSATAVQLYAGDRVSLRAFHDFGKDRELVAGMRETNLQIVRIPSVN